MTLRAIPRHGVLVVVLAGVGSMAEAAAAAQDPCPNNPNPQIWHVHAQAEPTVADGTQSRPLASLKEAVNCADVGATIRILFSDRALPGGVVLKDGQRLLGEVDRNGEWRSRITAAEGDAIVLADSNEVAGLHIEVVDGAAVFADNVTGAHLHWGARIGESRVDPAVLLDLLVVPAPASQTPPRT